MQNLLQLLTTGLTLLYGLAAVNYYIHFARQEPFAGRTCTPFLFGTFVLHLVSLALRTAHYERHPILGWAELLTVMAAAVTGIYLYVERIKANKSTGAFIVPLVVILQLASASMMPEVVEAKASLPSSALFGLHLIVAVLGYTAFAVGAIYGVMFLLLYRALKAKRFGLIFERLPSLEELADMGFWATFLGFLLLTATIALGAVMSLQMFPDFYKDPKVLSTLGVWVLYALIVMTRFVLNWRGARSVYLSLGGFVIALSATAITEIVLHSFHQFQA